MTNNRDVRGLKKRPGMSTVELMLTLDKNDEAFTTFKYNLYAYDDANLWVLSMRNLHKIDCINFQHLGH